MEIKIFALLTWIAAGVIVYYVYQDIRQPQSYVPNPVLSKPKSILAPPPSDDAKKFLPYSEMTKDAPRLNESTELELPVINPIGGYMINLGAPTQPDPSPANETTAVSSPTTSELASGQAEFFTSGEPQYLQSKRADIPIPPPVLKYSQPQQLVTNSAAFTQIKKARASEYKMGKVEFSTPDALYAAAN